ncbi:ABC transporter ATP-binding protein [Bacillaceae bacterium]
MSSIILETHRLTKRFRRFTAVKDLHLQVKKGEVYGFLGPNGAGKTTTIRMLLGLIAPSHGEIHIFGKNLQRNRMEILRKVGSLVETPSCYGHLTGEENLEITRRLRGVERREIDRVLKTVRLTGAKNKLVKHYSLGMKQRLGIAQALIGHPELLILDEPTNGLDPAGIQEIRELITSLPQQFGISVLVSSHILREVELIANRVGIIYNGQLLFQGDLEELRQRSRKGIRVEAKPSEQAYRFLKEQGFRVERDDAALIVDAPADLASVINRELVMKGFAVSHVSEQVKSLEDIFLEMTKGAGSL